MILCTRCGICMRRRLNLPCIASWPSGPQDETKASAVPGEAKRGLFVGGSDVHTAHGALPKCAQRQGCFPATRSPMLPREPAPLEALPAAAAGAAGARPVCATLFPLSVSLAWPVPLFLGPRPGWPRPSPAQPPDIIWLREKGPCMDGQLSHTHTHTHTSHPRAEKESARFEPRANPCYDPVLA